MDNSNGNEALYHVKFLMRNGSAIDVLTKMAEKAILDELKKAKMEKDHAHIDCTSEDGDYISVRFDAVDCHAMWYQKYKPKQAETQTGPRIHR